MNFNNTLLISLISLLVISLLTGCTNDKSKSEKETEENMVNNCELFDCLNQIEPDDSITKIDEVIGIKGETNEYSKNITWKLNNKESITLTYAGDEPILQANYDRADIQNETNDFHLANEITEMLNDGKKLTYNDVKEMIGSEEGTLSIKMASSKTYAWVDKDNQVFKATFKNGKNGKCLSATLGY